jgi:hypothetical protein
MISVGAKVYVEAGSQILPGVIASHHFASNRVYDLYTVRIATYNQQRQAWHVSVYGPVQHHKLTMRETHVPVLDQGVKHCLGAVPQWVQQLQG